jgi:hypothetical protein
MQKVVEIGNLFGPEGHNMPRVELAAGDTLCVVQRSPGHGSPKTELVDCLSDEMPIQACLRFPKVDAHRVLACYDAMRYGLVSIQVSLHGSIRKIRLRVSQPYQATSPPKK